jgi:hypothetical protein
MLCASCGFAGSSAGVDATSPPDAPDPNVIDGAIDAPEIDAPPTVTPDAAIDASPNVTPDAAIDAPPAPSRWVQTLSWSQVPTTLANFPILVVLNGSRVDYSHVSDDGSSLRFTDSGGGVLAHQIERWDESGTSYVWVRVPNLAATGDIRMVTGDTSALPAPPAPSQVWTANYSGVWHLNESVGDEQMNGTHADATGTQPPAQQRGNVGVRVAGGIGGVQEFDGTDDRIDVAMANFAPGVLTIEVRAFAQTLGSDFPHVLSARTANDSRGWQLYWENSGEKWTSALRIGPTLQRIFTTDGATAAWQTLAISYDGTRSRLYLNGAEIGSVAATGSVDALTSPFFLGGNPTLDDVDTSERDFDGYIDEVRVSNVARTPAWLATTHRTEIDALLTYGGPQPLP